MKGRPRHNCPICGSKTHIKEIGSKAGFVWQLCNRCDLRYVDVGDDPGLTDYYEGYYGEHSPVVPPSVRDRLLRLVSTFEPYRSTGRLLDVGFGAGWLMRAAAELGWSCWGTELATESMEAARSEGWQAFEGDLLTAGFPSRHFDVITLVEVLEHLVDPLTYIKEAARLLRPRGLLYGTTPNGGSANARVLGLNWSIYAAPEHLQLFTQSALKDALANGGLEVVQIRAEGLNPSELLARRGRAAAGTARVEAGYVLNERMQRTRRAQVMKSATNRLLSWTRLGDTLKFRARALDDQD